MSDNPTLLLSLVGEQPIPNLLPLWQYPQYAEVQFAASPTTRKVAKQLKSAIQNDSLLRHIHPLKTLELRAYEIQDTRTRLTTAIVKHQAQGKTVHINLTGGTKLMSLAALQAAFGSGASLMYISTEEKCIIWLGSDGSEQRREPIKVAINVGQYLNAHGFQIIDKANPFSTPPPKEGDELEMKVERILRFANCFDDIRRNVHILKIDGKREIRNELDLVVTCNGRMAVISCKSGTAESESGKESYRRAIYELSAISRREAAGIYCGKILVSSQVELPQAIRDRAAESNVRLVYGAEVENIVQHVRSALGE
ncbi:MAG: Card1-like endonuclease domain-containing protein [Anaerolineales bacterium]